MTEVLEPGYDYNWQTGYGCLTVSPSNLGVIRAYIQNQQSHHTTKTFEKELAQFQQVVEDHIFLDPQTENTSPV